MTDQPSSAASGKLFTFSLVLATLALLMAPMSVAMLASDTGPFALSAFVIAVAQLVGGTIAGVAALVQHRRTKGRARRGWVAALSVASFLVGIGGGVLAAVMALLLTIIAAGGGPIK